MRINKISVKNKLYLIEILSALLVSSLSWGDQRVRYTQSKKECYSFSREQLGNYCVHVPVDAKTNGSVAYLLHGRNLDEQTWNDDTFYTSMIQRYWEDKNISPPVVVTVSFGPIWLLAPKGKAEMSGLAEVFKNEVIPEVEKRIGVPKSRIVFGESMGGLNALLIALPNPKLFKKVASLCPGIYMLSPYAPSSEIQAFLERTGADPKVVYGVTQLAKNYFSNEEEWNQVSPINQIEMIDPKDSPEIYLSCGLYDIYGNFEGSERFAEIAKSRGVNIQWQPIYGGHCATDVSSLADFLAK